MPRSEALNFPHPLSAAARRVAGVELVDPTKTLCRGGSCPAVIRDALVYRNASHLTATYVRTLRSWLAGRLPERLRH